ncbi:MAG TPA: hypothetical protein VEH56_00240 [Candidatus Saccharimonadales bacterium]|nr:hypothetical protein [Candidatus Saccharimonadales bacterium]
MSKENRDNIRDVVDVVKSLRKDMDKNLVEVKGQLKLLQKEATRTVKDKPLLALGVAFVIGMAVGIALASSSD